MSKKKINLFDSFKKFLWDIFEGSITHNAIRDLPDPIMYFFGALLDVLVFSLFLFFLISGYKSSQSVEYLVPLNNDDPGECAFVLKSIPVSTYYADYGTLFFFIHFFSH